jgi:FkbM family methyltransferase
VLAFQPTPQLAEGLRKSAHSIQNYVVVEAAVSETDGSANLNVAGFGDWGCSSLLDFNETRGETWAGREDLQVSEVVPVKTVRLDTMMQELGLREIDYLHVDAQGGDLQVLRSLGKYIDRVRCGVVEVPMSEDVKLYEGQHSEADMLEFFNENGLRVAFQSLQQNEKNLYFRQRH